MDINTLYENWKVKKQELPDDLTALCEMYEKYVLNSDFGYAKTMQLTDAFDEIVEVVEKYSL